MGSISISPSSATLEPGEVQGFQATVVDRSGNPLQASVRWEATGGTITSDGVYTAGSETGGYEVRARSGDVSATAGVTIFDAAPQPASIEVSPQSVELEPGQSQRFSVIVRDESGETIDAPVQWEAEGGTITADGLYTAGPETGGYEVRASSGDVSGAAGVTIVDVAPQPASIEVSPRSVDLAPGESQQLEAVVRDASGQAIDAPVQWEADGGTITADGLYTAGTETGDYMVLARSGDVSATAEVTVVEPAAQPASIEVSPRSVDLTPGESQQFEAVVRDASGQAIDAPVQWEAAGGTITADGLYTAGSEPGDYTVLASSGDVSGTALVTISAPAPPSSGGALTKVQQHTVSEATDRPTATFPEAPQAGNLLIAVLGTVHDEVVSAPPGWTRRLAPEEGARPLIYVYDRISDGTESTVSFTLTTPDAAQVALFEYAGGTTVTAGAQAQAHSDGQEVTSQSTGSAPGSPEGLAVAVVRLSLLDTPLSGWTNGFTEQADFGWNSGHWSRLGIATKDLTSSASVETSAGWGTPARASGALVIYQAGP